MKEEIKILKYDEYKDFYSEEWVKELQKLSKTECDVTGGVLSFFFPSEKKADLALKVCMRRNILTTKMGYIFNTIENTYRVSIILQPTEGKLIPKATHPLIKPILD